jgi:phage terminase large subunit GpA-like protein
MNARAKLHKFIAALLPPPDPLLISEWAEKFAYLPAEGNAEPGKFHNARMPYEIAMLDDPLDPTVSEIYWMIGSQLGKTLCIILIIEFYIDHAPTSILAVYPTIDSTRAWMRDKFVPTVKETPRLVGKLKEPRARDSESTALNRKFPGGGLTCVGANSPSGLRQRSKKVVICDEIDAMETTSEGDPLMLADKRAETFFDAVKLKSSTPTLKGSSRIEDGIERSDKQRYFLPCHACGEMQWLKWSQIKFSFDKDELSRLDNPNFRPDDFKDWKLAIFPDKRCEQSFYVCEQCGVGWSDQQRLAAIASGHKDNPPIVVNGIELRAEWRATAPFKGIRGRILSGLYQTIGKKRAFKSYLHQFAENFLTAKHGGKETLQVWTNTFLSETFEVEAEQVEWSPLLERVEDYEGELPMEVCLLILSGDIHPDRIEMEVVGWGDEEETWGIQKYVVWGDFDLPETQMKVDDFTNKKWKHPSGVEIGITAAAFDSGHKAKAVYRFCKARAAKRFYAVKGSSTPHSPLVTPNRNKHYGIWLYNVGTDTAKDSIFSRLKLDDPGARYCHFPKGQGYTEKYFKQLCSEKLQTYMERGVVKRKWVKQFERNESLDLRVYNLAAYDILKPNMLRVRAAVIPKSEVTMQERTDYVLKPTAATPKVSAEKPAPVKFRQNSFVGQHKGWL